jgi:predicted alpha/beta-hydrolase family hydrolase
MSPRAASESAVPATGEAELLDIDTPHGPARVHLHAGGGPPRGEGPAGALVLGHGAAGGVSAPDLTAATAVAHGEGWSVALVEQPYRVAGRRSSPPAAQLDNAWTAVVGRLRAEELAGLPLVTGGRSAGARVACRTAAATGAAAVLCLAFPVHPPGRADDPSKSRQPELDAVKLPVLIVQGTSDPFGMPKARKRHKLVKVADNHSLRKSRDEVAEAVRGWLPQIVG